MLNIKHIAMTITAKYNRGGQMVYNYKLVLSGKPIVMTATPADIISLLAWA